jgi:hypothetical protein
MFPESRIDERLVISASGRMKLLTEPLKDIFV